MKNIYIQRCAHLHIHSHAHLYSHSHSQTNTSLLTVNRPFHSSLLTVNSKDLEVSVGFPVFRFLIFLKVIQFLEYSPLPQSIWLYSVCNIITNGWQVIDSPLCLTKIWSFSCFTFIGISLIIKKDDYSMAGITFDCKDSTKCEFHITEVSWIMV